LIDNSDKDQRKVKLILVITILSGLFIFMYFLYSLSMFVSKYNKAPENIGSDSFIDIKGLDEVKLKLDKQ